MCLKKQIGFMGSLIILLTVGTACPTIPDSVSGGGGGGGGGGTGGGAPPGEAITWPALQIDPLDEDTAGFNKVTSADMNNDGLVDLVTAAYESQPIQIHLQQRSEDGEISFQSFSIAGSGPIVQVTELKVADLDQDGHLDIVLSMRDNGFTPLADCAARQCSVVALFAPADPADALNWEEVNLTQSFGCILVDGEPFTFSTFGRDGNDRCYSSLDVGDANDDGFPDLVAAFNGCDDDVIPFKEIELWLNPANDQIRFNEELVDTVLEDEDGDGEIDGCSVEVEFGWEVLTLQLTTVDAGAVRFSDVDLDSDLDVMVLRPETKTFDLTWQANPLVPTGSANAGWSGLGDLHPIGESDAGLDLIETGDLDGDGLEDVLAIGKNDRLLRWFRHPENPAAQTFPWEVYNIVQYTNLTPTAVDIDDIDGDGQVDIAAAADGRIRWFTPLEGDPFDPWNEQFVTDDPAIAGGDTGGQFPPINSVHFVDIDDDGRADIVATLDREGVDNDAVAWFRNEDITGQ